MTRLVLTHAAQANLFEIAGYIQTASGSTETARIFVEKLLNKCEDLAALPGRVGRERRELLPGLRSTPYVNYVIFFRYTGPPDRQEIFEVVN